MREIGRWPKKPPLPVLLLVPVPLLLLLAPFMPLPPPRDAAAILPSRLAPCDDEGDDDADKDLVGAPLGPYQDALGGIDDEQGSLAGRKGSANLIGEINVTWCVDQV